jgi:DMSO/TMAO reductase YedYZ molybdopterin-dependent catalytic subunit
VADTDQRIEEGRALLQTRFGASMAKTPSLADTAPQGEGPKNRHGMPREPPGQNEFDKGEWPVLDLGDQPAIAPERWKLTVDGLVESPLSLGFAELQALPQVELDADFHCVTGWSVYDLHYGGVQLLTLLALARPTAEATHLMAYGADGYSTNLPLEEAIKPDVLLVHRIDGAPVPRERGGPVRVMTPQLWAWKGAKWVNRIELMPHDRRGYWEIRGYSNTAWPWRDDRMW